MWRHPGDASLDGDFLYKRRGIPTDLNCSYRLMNIQQFDLLTHAVAAYFDHLYGSKRETVTLSTGLAFASQRWATPLSPRNPMR